MRVHVVLGILVLAAPFVAPDVPSPAAPLAVRESREQDRQGPADGRGTPAPAPKGPPQGQEAQAPSPQGPPEGRETPAPGPTPVKMRVVPPASERIEVPPGGITVPMVLRENRPEVDVRINGEGPYPFVLDTGAMTTVVSNDLAARLALPAIGEVHVGSPAGGKPVPARMIRLDRLSVGDAVVQGAMAVAMDLSNVLRGSDAAVGVLSAHLFEGFLLTVDYPAGAVSIRHGTLPEADGATIIQYEPSDPFPSVPLSLAGVEVRAHLDTGSARGLTLPAAYIDRLPLASKPVEAAKARLIDTETKVLGSTLKGDLKIGKFVFQNPEVQFTEKRLPAANVGSKILSRFAVTLDSKNRRIRLEEPKRGAE